MIWLAIENRRGWAGEWAADLAECFTCYGAGTNLNRSLTTAACISCGPGGGSCTNSAVSGRGRLPCFGERGRSQRPAAERAIAREPTKSCWNGSRTSSIPAADYITRQTDRRNSRQIRRRESGRRELPEVSITGGQCLVSVWSVTGQKEGLPITTSPLYTHHIPDRPCIPRWRHLSSSSSFL